jgi:hypothetical protein
MLVSVGAPETEKIANAVDQAATEASSANPEKEEVAGRIERALTLAKQAESFSAHMEKVAPRVIALAGWLGEAGKGLLRYIGQAG